MVTAQHFRERVRSPTVREGNDHMEASWHRHNISPPISTRQVLAIRLPGVKKSPDSAILSLALG
jgi:hypothetical protein